MKVLRKLSIAINKHYRQQHNALSAVTLPDGLSLADIDISLSKWNKKTITIPQWL
jgi:hypothetical protein